jgi:hypothetical protein
MCYLQHKHNHNISRVSYNGTLKQEYKILKFNDYGINSEYIIGSRVLYLKFDRYNRKYWIERGQIIGWYPNDEDAPRQYHIKLNCGGRISGALKKYLKVNN